mmetsp:Transcript_31385/g.36084  ORF Transcript_31385/g.36084 Transcript_31385/m.36084 type:complete len:493 (+) Transcript_31385:116-1594(+)
MKFSVGTSSLLLLQSKAPSRAFSSPLTSFYKKNVSTGGIHRYHPVPLTFRGGSFDSNNAATEFKATVSDQSNDLTHDNNQNSDGNVSNDTKHEEQSRITKEAMASIDITGTSTFIDTFGSTPFINTSKLTQSKNHRVLFILGGPGAGKGTQSENIVSTYKCIHLSVGELLRKERLRGDKSPHAELIEKCLVAGQIVPVEISLGLVRNAMDEAVSADSSSDTKYGQPIFLVDGFPRNYDNLSGWTNNMPNFASVIGSLVYDCPISVLEDRIMSRAETSGRSDDNLESARKRFKTFQEQTMSVVHVLEEVEQIQAASGSAINANSSKIGKLHVQHIAGEGTVDEVWEATQSAMDEYIKNDILSANAMLLQAIEEKNIEIYSQLTSSQMLSMNQDKPSVEESLTSTDAIDNKILLSEIEKTFQSFEVLHDCSNKRIVNQIRNTEVQIHNGTKAVVSYDRIVKDATTAEILSEFRESRVWSHEEKGWICIHFERKP